MVYHIWMGDDDGPFLEEAKGQLRSALVGRGMEGDWDFTCHTDPSALSAAILRQRDSCQFLVLDTEYGAANGVALARELRGAGLDCPLVYLTGYRDYVFDSFATRPLEYLLKPPDYEKLAALIHQDFRERYAAARIALKVGGQTLSLSIGEICAVEAYDHHVRLWLTGDILEWNGTLAALTAQLPAGHFCQCHGSFWVSLAHIRRLGRTEIQMDNGAVFPVSRRFYAEVARQQYASLEQ